MELKAKSNRGRNWLDGKKPVTLDPIKEMDGHMTISGNWVEKPKAFLFERIKNDGNLEMFWVHEKNDPDVEILS